MNIDQAESLEAAVVQASEAITKEETRGSLSLWVGVLGSPLAWAGHLVANYSLEEWFACSDSAKTRGEILGVRVDTVSILINTSMLALAVASTFVALTCWRALRDHTDDGGRTGEPGKASTERSRWMAFVGVVEGTFFIGVILLGYLPPLTLGICATTP